MAHFQAGHQFAEVTGGQRVKVDAFAHAAQQVAEAFVMRRAVGHQQVFVARVKSQQAVTGEAFGQQLLPTGIDEHAGQEVFPQHRVIQPTVFFHWQVGVACTKCLGVNATPAALCRRAVVAVDLDPFQAARGRFLHEDVAAQVGMFRRHLLAVIVQWLRYIELTVHRADGLRVGRVAHQADRFAGDTQADRDFGAQRHKLEVVGQGLAAQQGLFVSAVEAHVLA